MYLREAYGLVSGSTRVVDAPVDQPWRQQELHMMLLCGQRLSTTTVELIEPSILEGVEGEKSPSSSTGSPTYWYIIAAHYVRQSGTTLPNCEVYARLSQEEYERKTQEIFLFLRLNWNLVTNEITSMAVWSARKRKSTTKKNAIESSSI
ncbi:hypothetical protein GQ600_17281 [Phytophthora cactorum]|nr:hypothetical protein GQ600_17281 [Phytophthora cactorum]